MCLISVKWNIYPWILSKKVVNFWDNERKDKATRKPAKEMISELENKGVAENDNQAKLYELSEEAFADRPWSRR